MLLFNAATFYKNEMSFYRFSTQLLWWHSNLILQLTKMIGATNIVSSNLLVKIDQLFACNVGNSIALPQIVVVGDQSSGKSSVLEGLTGLPFPRDSGLCTRFATQITFRRSTEAYITISIIPAKNSSSQDRERLQGWTKSGLKSLDTASFADIMAEVLFSSLELGIGLQHTGDESHGRRNHYRPVSEDVFE